MFFRAISGAFVFLLFCPLAGEGGILYELNDRFGVALNFSYTHKTITDYPFSDLGSLGWYVDGQVDYPAGPGSAAGPGREPIERVTVVGTNLGNAPPAAGTVRSLVEAHPQAYPPGSAWMVGHELGRDSFSQDPRRAGQPMNFLADKYARAYHDWSVQIKQADPSYRIMLGAIVPNWVDPSGWDTAAFLRHVFDSYEKIYKSPLPVDIFNLRLYFTGREANLEHFKSAVIQMRHLMSQSKHGETYRDAELWLTGYGFDDATISKTYARDMLVQWTDWLCGYADADIFSPQFGLASDEYRLVQRWAWFPVDDSRALFAATRLFDQNGDLTLVGEKYAGYTRRPIPEPASAAIFLLACMMGTHPLLRRHFCSFDFRQPQPPRPQ